MGGTFKVQIINANGKNVGAGKTVKFTIAGKTYSKKTDKNGYASLKITQKPKTHTITTKYGKFITKNKITIQPVLTAKNIMALVMMGRRCARMAVDGLQAGASRL